MKKDIREKSAPEGSHSGMILELERGFSKRLKQAIGNRSIHSIAKSCGMSDSLIRKYLTGSLPGLDKALILAVETGVSLEWLATGQELPEKQPKSVSVKPSLDVERMEAVIAKTRRNFLDRGISLSPEEEAKIIRLIYELNSEDAENSKNLGFGDGKSEAMDIPFSSFDVAKPDIAD
ncbi:helix-turn-helix domain-containing protein [Halomonas sp. I5-271120]|uniref:helix-turn-helix domain-containing protein n=1 Tax=Halomonas sp. I5-271120 TaxID=3061632 RepID=UPI0027146353|nr:helix-turn-helix domain-containing protein [Halomonas sp. I5-271120]